MKSQLIIKNIIKKDKSIKVEYDVTGKLREFFDMNNKFEITYSESIDSVPNSIAIIPFVSNVLPIIWLSNTELIIEELDYNYYKSIDKTRNNFNSMYNTEIFKGIVKVNNKVKNPKSTKKENSSVFCSGGVDSTFSLVECLNNNIKPLLITIWGGDVWSHNVEGWNSLKEYSSDLGKKLKLKNLYIKTNFRKFIYEHTLTEKLLSGRINDSWWRGIQHGIGLIGHVAPLAYLHNITTHYIPATLNCKNLGATCGSFPLIDESVRFMNCKIIHSGYKFTRLEKVHKIVNDFENKDIKLRVCYMDKGSQLNCCKCEKCFMTVMELITAKAKPQNWGFDITDEEIGNIPKYLKKNASDSPISIEIWDDIINYCQKHKELVKNNKNYKWILNYRNKRNIVEYLVRKVKLK